MTQLVYLEYPHLFKLSSTILEEGMDNRGYYIILDKTLFYSQGGGQPADQGSCMIKETPYSLEVQDVRNHEGGMRHYYGAASLPFSLKGTSVELAVNESLRVTHSRYHTAGHLIADVLENEYPFLKPYKGHHFPGEAYVAFKEKDQSVVAAEDVQTLLDSKIQEDRMVETKDLEESLKEDILKELPYTLPEGKPLRVCHIEGFRPVPCGGTHVTSLKKLGQVRVKKCNSKKGTLKVSYEMAP